MEEIKLNTEGDVQPNVAYEEYIMYTERVLDLREALPFPGLNDASYSKLKADSLEFPGFVTDIDDLVPRFKSEGIKVILWKNLAYVLPFNSEINDSTIENDSVLPRHLDANGATNPNLQRLIKAGKQPSNPNVLDDRKTTSSN